MNQLLFERATGSLGQNALARLQYTQLLHAFRPAPQLRFDGGEQGTAIDVETAAGGAHASPSSAAAVAAAARRPGTDRDLWAHQQGINALALERFDGRILISGGSDATIRIWDLEQCPSTAAGSYVYKPVAQIARAESAGQQVRPGFRRPAPPAATPSTTRHGHRFGVTHLSFYPFDAAAFLSSSFDQTLKLWSTATARLSGSFDLGAKIYRHAISPVADHLLVACATQHPAVRLVDLRSGAAVQSLVAPGQVNGGVLSVAWSPRHEHILASGAVDGTVRIWDVRRASGLVALLDQEDSLGLVAGRAGDHYNNNNNNNPTGLRISSKAHAGPVNGLTWSDDGAYIVSAGHDRRIRVWDAATGANTLVSFGPSVRNGGLTSVDMVVSPTGATPPMQELLFWPNESEILVFGLHDGRIVTRLRGMGPTQFAVRMASSAARGSSNGNHSNNGNSNSSSSTTPRTPSSSSTPTPDRSAARRNRVTSLVWRGAGGAGCDMGGVVMGGRDAIGGLYSGHMDGQIRAWVPQPGGGGDEAGSGEEDEDSAQNRTPQATEERDRKRRALDQAYRSLMGTQITFQ